MYNYNGGSSSKKDDDENKKAENPFDVEAFMVKNNFAKDAVSVKSTDSYSFATKRPKAKDSTPQSAVIIEDNTFAEETFRDEEGAEKVHSGSDESYEEDEDEDYDDLDEDEYYLDDEEAVSLKQKILAALEEDYTDFGPHVEEQHQNFRQAVFSAVKHSAPGGEGHFLQEQPDRNVEGFDLVHQNALNNGHHASNRGKQNLQHLMKTKTEVGRGRRLFRNIKRILRRQGPKATLVDVSAPDPTAPTHEDDESDRSVRPNMTELDILTRHSQYGDISTIILSLFGYSHIPNVGTRLLGHAFDGNGRAREKKTEEEKMELRRCGIGLLIGCVLSILVFGLSIGMTERHVDVPGPEQVDPCLENPTVWKQCDCNQSIYQVSEDEWKQYLEISSLLEKLPSSTHQLSGSVPPGTYMNLTCEAPVLAKFWMSGGGGNTSSGGGNDIIARYVLSTLYFSLFDHNEDKESALLWELDTNSSVCGWPGVRCDSHTDQVEELHLSGFGLSGTLPSELQYLSKLRVLDMSNNNITHLGAFNGGINLRRLDLGSNQLEGDLTTMVLEKLPTTSLIELRLDDNNLTGPIGDTLFSTKLQKLFLQNNRLTGTVPSSLSESQLEYLNLAKNTFSGSLPNTTLPASLEFLSLAYNGFDGQLPLEWADHRSLLETLLLQESGIDTDTAVDEQFCGSWLNLQELLVDCFSDEAVPCSCCTCWRPNMAIGDYM